ncbi:MAG TPA: ATP-binding protein [Terriglobia bacterium]|nr:ATP-binding protein [Terriglobia bacterium]
MENDRRNSRKTFLIFLLILVPALFFLAWSQASFNLSFIHPSSAQETILLLFLSALIFLAFVIFTLILGRILLKLYVERRQGQLGSRFRTKMVAAFLGLSLVPVCFLFAFSYGLLNRSIDKWFGIPFDIVRSDAAEIVKQLQLLSERRALHETSHMTADVNLRRAILSRDKPAIDLFLAQDTKSLNLKSAFCFDRDGQFLAHAGDDSPRPTEVTLLFPQISSGQLPAAGAVARLHSVNLALYLAAQKVLDDKGNLGGTVIGVVSLPLDIQRTADEIQDEAEKYNELSQERRAVKRTDLSMLLLLTLLILFVATWFALFVSKQVTIPIQALAEATHEVSQGNLGYQVTVRGDDELGTLIKSFNDMTRQLQESRAAIVQAAQELQLANQKLEERGHTMEAILENIPNGVISLDPQGGITQVNSTAERMFGREKTRSAQKLTDLFSEEDAREVSLLFRRAHRQGVVTRYMELDLDERRVFVALTLSSIRARHGSVGAVLVVEDLSELLRAQKAAAWREVAQRIAHEIKNPLTPIQLSSERIQRLVARGGAHPDSSELAAAVAESAGLIDREVTTLKTLVDEFSTFARFPSSKPVPAALNTIIENALNIFDGRLKGIVVHSDLSPALPLVQADPEQMKRAVVNLIDNAAEALETVPTREIWVRTSLDAQRDVVELVVADSGPGIPPDALDKLFLPYFSTKQRGTGLGLAIVSRIISEHNGTIRVEHNRPTGAMFVIELPVERVTANAEV